MNAYSIVHNFDQPVYEPDFNLVQTALGYKQQKLNVNRDKLQNIYDQFSILRVRNSYYQDYIEDRLNQVIDINRNYHNLDLSDDNFAAVISANVGQILDDQVYGAIMDTKIMEAEDAEWEAMRVKADGKYSTQNHEYALAMSDRNRYLQTQDFGNRYRGGASFIEYTDYSKKWNDFAKDLKERLGWTYFVNEQGVGGFRYQDKMRVVKAEDVQSEMARVFNSKDIQQMQIDGWGQYRNLSTEQFASEWNNHIGSKSSVVEAEVKRLEAGIASGKMTATQVTQARQEIERLNGVVTSYNNQLFENIYDPQRTNLANLQGVLYQEKYMDGIVSTYAGVEHLERKEDEVYSSYMSFVQKAQQHSDDIDYKYKKLQLENNRGERRLALDAADKGFKYNPETGQWEAVAGEGNMISRIAQTFDRNNPQLMQPANLVGQAYDESLSAMTEVRKMFDFELPDGNKTGWLTNQQMTEVITGINNGTISLDEDIYLSEASGKRKIQFSKLTDEQKAQLTKHAFKAMVEDPKVRDYQNAVRGNITSQANVLGALVSDGGSLNDLNTFKQIATNFNFKIDKTDKGFEFVPIQNGQEQFYNLLAKRRNANQGKGEKLTEAENKTLNAYIAMTIADDQSLDETHRKAHYHWLSTEGLQGVNTKGMLPKLKPTNENYRYATTIERSASQFGIPTDLASTIKATDTPLTVSGKIMDYLKENRPDLDVNDRVRERAVLEQRVYKAQKVYLGGLKQSLISFTDSRSNTQYRDKNGKTQYFGSQREAMNNRMSAADRAFFAAWEAGGKDERALGNYISAANEPGLFKFFADAYAITVDPKKSKFAYYRDDSGQIHYGVTTLDEEKGTNLLSGIYAEDVEPILVEKVFTLNQAKVQELEKIDLVARERQYIPGFDAPSGRSLPLGNTGITNPVKMKSVTEEFKRDMYDFPLFAENESFRNLVMGSFERYVKGDFLVNVVSDGESYHVVLEDPSRPENDRIVSMLPNQRPPTRLSYDDLAIYRRDAQIYKQALFNEYLQTLAEDFNRISNVR